MKRNAYVIVIAAGVIALAAWQLAPAGAPDRTADTAPAISPLSRTTPNSPAALAPATAGYVAHLDENGQFVEGPVSGNGKELEAALGQSISTSSDGLVEVQSSVAGGGTMVDLQGRFQSTTVATAGADGKVSVPCLGNEAEVESFTAAGAADQPAGKE